MKKTIGILALVAMLLVITATLVSAGTAGPVEPKTPPLTPADGPLTAESFSHWFVEFESAPAVKGTSMQTLATERDAFASEAGRIGLAYEVRYNFSTLWNGMSVTIDRMDVNKLYRLRGVKAIYPVFEIKLPELFTSEENPNLFSSLSMIGADVAQSELGYTGAGIKIAIVDTGVDYDHPDLGGCFGPFCKVMAGYDLVDSDDDPDDDCHGHGTHVAGIAAANGEVVGVAPHSRLGAYRVFDCSGSGYADVTLAAMEMAYADGMDVVNYSGGSDFGWPQYPTTVGASNLVDEGMVVVSSAGNAGEYGLYGVGNPANGEKIISVASFDNVMKTYPYAIVDGILPAEAPNLPDGVPFGVVYDVMQYSPPAPTSGTEPIVYVGRACNGDPLVEDPTGKLALIRRGDCSFYDKAFNAIAAGATGVVVHNNQPGLFSGTLGTAIDDVHPVVSITEQDGMNIRALTEATWRWTDNLVSIPSATGGLISDFSSYGLAPDLSLKPDIGAPGGDIWSTYPLEFGGHVSASGTSMSSPHVAGAAALMRQMFPVMPATQIRDLLQNTAVPQPWSLNPGLGYYDHSFRQGAGMMQVDAALMSQVSVTPGKLSVGEGPKTFTLDIANRSAMPLTYELSYESGVAASGIIEIDGFWLTDETVTFSQDMVHLVPFGHITVDVTISPPSDVVPWNTLYGGWINLTPFVAEGEEMDALSEQVYRVPYAGFTGDYQEIEHLGNVYGMPWFGDVDWNPVSEGHVFTMEGLDYPTIIWHQDHQSPLVKLEVLSGYTGRRAYPIYSTIWEEPYFIRNAAYNYVFDYSWDGTKMFWNSIVLVPDGSYHLRLSVLKALGDPMNPADWEMWTSPMFYIDRSE